MKLVSATFSVLLTLSACSYALADEKDAPPSESAPAAAETAPDSQPPADGAASAPASKSEAGAPPGEDPPSKDDAEKTP